MIPVRSDDRSKRWNSGWASSAMNIVGTPYRVVHRSASTASSTAPGSNAASGSTIAAPWRRAREVAEHHPEAVVERHRDADPVGFRVAAALTDEEPVVQDVVVRERRALREAGRAARVLDVDRVVEVEVGGSGPQRVDRNPGRALTEIVPLRRVEEDHLLERGDLGVHLGDHRHVVRRLERRRRDQHAAAGLVERVLELARPVRRVDVDQDHADLRRRVLHEDPLDVVGAPDADPVAGLEPEVERARARSRRRRRRTRRTSTAGPGDARRAPRGRARARPSARGWRRWSRPAAGSPPDRTRTDASMEDSSRDAARRRAYATARGTTSLATACSSTSSIRVFSSGVPIVARTPTPANVRRTTPCASQNAPERRRAVEHREPDEVGLRVGHRVAGVAQRLGHPVALRDHLGDPARVLGGVVERRQRGGLRDAAHRERRPHLAQRGDDVGAARTRTRPAARPASTPSRTCAARRRSRGRAAGRRRRRSRDR